MEIASSTFRKHSMELDTGKTEIAIVFKVERANKKWEAAANDWKLRWMNKEYKFKKGPTRWLGSHIDRSMNWKAHVSTCVERALWKQQKVRRFMLAHGVNRKLARTIAWSMSDLTMSRYVTRELGAIIYWSLRRRGYIILNLRYIKKGE
jgi:hypothetical protein